MSLCVYVSVCLVLFGDIPWYMCIHIWESKGKTDVTKSVFEISNLRSNCIFLAQFLWKCIYNLIILTLRGNFRKSWSALTCPLKWGGVPSLIVGELTKTSYTPKTWHKHGTNWLFCDKKCSWLVSKCMNIERTSHEKNMDFPTVAKIGHSNPQKNWQMNKFGDTQSTVTVFRNTLLL